MLLVAEIGFRPGVWLRRRDPFFLQGLMPVAEVASLLGLLALVLAAVLMLIADLDRSQEGMLTVSQQALWDLQRQFATPAP